MMINNNKNYDFENHFNASYIDMITTMVVDEESMRAVNPLDNPL